MISLTGTSSFLSGKNIATTGERVFGQDPVNGPNISDREKFWNENEYGLLRADFAVLTNLVRIDLIFDEDDAGFLAAYGPGGTLLTSVLGAGDGRGLQPFARLEITRPTADIAYIVAGGSAAEGLFLDNLQFNDRRQVPEPSAYALMAIGLAVAARPARRNRT